MSDTSSQGATRRGVLKTGAIGLGSVAGAFGVSSGASAAATPDLLTAMVGGPMDWFLNIPGNPGIPGDSVDDEHQNWIEPESVQFGSGSTAGTSTASTSTVKATVAPVSFTSRFGTASPRLFAATMSARRFASAVVEGIRVADTTRTKVIELRMQDVTVTGYSNSNGGDWPSDSFSLSFPKLTFTYWPQNSDGTLGTPIVATWDAKTGIATTT